MTDKEHPHNDCIKALALIRMEYNPDDGLYSRWIYESLSYAIERIAAVDQVNTYIGKERIP